MKKVFRFSSSLIAILLALSFSSSAQKLPYKPTRDDTLRGTLTPVRTCYDVSFYDLQMNVDVKKHFISGNNVIRFHVVNDFDSIQVDLFSRMKIEKILFNGNELKYRRELNSVFIRFPEMQHAGADEEITISYSGNPIAAKNPPWDGGFVWKKDIKNRDWVGVACEGTGASSWWPCKDAITDEPDSMRMTFTVPTGLVCVSNGRLRDTLNNGDGTTTWKFHVSYPINNYDVTFNLAHYAHFSDQYISGNEKLDLNYYVLDYNLSQAMAQFQQVKGMMACYEKYFGPYPFPRDGYKLVETSYWGMEHQTAIAYGNDYINNKQGFDFIIVHESAHEWWGNNVTANDYADLWIHEGFATYAEALYVECTKSYNDAVDYLNTLRWQIRDSFPIIGPREIDYDGARVDNDMYFKGAWMLHTFRSVLNDDSLFFQIIKSIQQEFALKIISTDQLIAFINRKAGKDYTPFFNQYLYHKSPPILEYKLKQKGKNLQLSYHWKTDVQNFEMPVEVTSSYSYLFGKQIKTYTRINATNEWQVTTIPNFEGRDFDVNADKFYVKKREVK